MVQDFFSKLHGISIRRKSESFKALSLKMC